MTVAVVSVPVFTFMIRRNRSETAVTIVYFLTNQGAWRDFAETGVQLNLFVWFFKEPIFGVFHYIFLFQFSFQLSFIPAGGSSIGWLSPKFKSFCLSRALLSSVMIVFISVLKPSIPRFRVSRGRRFQYFWTLRLNVNCVKERLNFFFSISSFVLICRFVIVKKSANSIVDFPCRILSGET